MLIGVLGTLIARGDDGQVAPVTGPTRRQLLAALATRAGHPVPVSTLVDDLWGDKPPGSALKTLQSHLVRLRRDLATIAGSGELVVTEGAAYRLALSSLAVDAGCFERDLRLGTEALAGGDAEEAAGHLDAALAWWRGEAYAEFPEAPFARAERVRLADLHALAHERRIEAGLRLGRGASLVGEIEARLAVDPYRERLWQQLMVALYRADRQADALAAYHRARALLVEDLGVEPGPDLRRTEQRVLAQDDDLRAGDGRADITGDPARLPSADAAAVCPYVGLAGYDETDSALFVAREQVTARLLGRLRAGNLLVVTGDSGVGKSSVVRAGLLPAVRAGGLPGSEGWTCAVIRPGELPRAVAGGQMDLLVVDQAEELFTLDALAPAAAADGVLATLLDRGVCVVLVLRVDFYGRLGDLPRLADRVGGATELVAPLNEDELRRVIVQPARRVGLAASPELVAEALADVRGQAGALPLLSAALLRTWHKRHGTTLTVSAYREGGGVRGALEATAEEAYLSLPDAERAGVRRLLVRLATRQGGVWSRRPLPRDVVVDGPAPMVSAATLEALASGRIVTLSAQRVELVHEALLEHWPRLRDWLDERAAVAGLVEWLGTAARAWDSGGREDADLARGPRLQAALDWRAGSRDDVAPLEHDFITGSDRAAQGELLAVRERADREARGRRRLRYVAAALAVATVIASVGVVVALRARSAQQQAALSADARRVAALSLTAPDLRTSLLLAAAAYRLQPSADSRGALLSALQRSGTALWSASLPGRGQFAGVDEASRYLWTMDLSRTVYRYDLATHEVVTKFPARADFVAALSPDGGQVVVAGQSFYFDEAGNARVSVLDAADGAALTVLPVLGVLRIPHTAVFTGDGRWLAVPVATDASGSVPTSTVAVFDTSNYRRPPRLLRLDAPVADLAAGRDTLAVITTSGLIRLVTAADFAVVAQGMRPELARSDPGSQTPYRFTLSPDARWIALTEPGDDALPYLLDAGDPAGPARPLTRLDGAVVDVVFSRGGGLLAVSSSTGAVDVFRVSDGEIAVRPLGAGPNQATHLAWSGSGDTDTGLYAVGRDNHVLALDLHAGPRLVSATGPSMTGMDWILRTGTQVVVVDVMTGSGSAFHRAVHVTDLGTGASTTTTIPVDPNETFQAVSVDAHARHLLITTQAVPTPQGSDKIMWSNLYELPSGHLINRFVVDGKPSDHNTDVGTIAPDGRTATYAVAPHTLAVRSLPDGATLRTFEVNFSGRAGDRHWISPFAYAPDGRLLVLGFDPFPHYRPPGSTLPDSPDPYPNVPEDQLVGIVDVRTGHLDGQVGGFGQQGIITTAAWSPDGTRVVIGTQVGTMQVVDARDLSSVSPAVRAHVDGIETVSFSPDGSTVVSAADDGLLAFWDADTLRPIGSPIAPLHEGVWAAWYRDDGSVTGYTPGDADGTEQWFVMPAQPERWLAAVCELAGTPLTRDEWDRYVGVSRPYRSTC